MRTVIFYQGFNRVENRNIIRLEQTKLNHLLTEERRVIETLFGSVKQRIETAPHRLLNAELIWNKVQNHSTVQSLRLKIASLTDAYPQFLAQVKAVRTAIEERFFASFEAVRRAAQVSMYRR